MLVTGLVRLTRDPESRQAGSSNVCKFTVVDNKKFKDKEVATFLDCEAWGKQGEVIQSHFVKGNRIFLIGELEQENWEDKESGAKRSKVKVKVSDFKFVDAAAKSDESGETEEKPVAAKKSSAKSGGQDPLF